MYHSAKFFLLFLISIAIVSCGIKAQKNSEIPNQPASVSSVEKTNSDNSNKIQTDCYQSETRKSFLQCTLANNADAAEELKKMEKKILGDIEVMFDSEKRTLDERDRETIQFIKQNFSESQDHWYDFAKANCAAIGAYNREQNFTQFLTECKEKALKDRLQALFFNFYTSFDNDERVSERHKGFDMLKEMPCDKTNRGGTIEVNDCASQRLESAKKRLASLVAKIKPKLDEKSRDYLDSAQNIWDKLIDEDCAAATNFENPYGTMATSTYLTCVDVGIEKRILELKSLYAKEAK
jgi:uncharacterized protein YecT (DUF1311 family)